MFTKILRGAIRFFSERFGGRPYVDCLICAVMVVLRWMGWLVVDGDQKKIRAAIPGQPKGGLTFGQVYRGLRALFSVVPHVGTADEAFILSELKLIGARGKGKAVFVIAVRNEDVPAASPLRKVTGVHYVGLHAISIVAKTEDDTHVYILNPMGRDATHPPKPTPPGWEPYHGNLVPVTDIWPAAERGPSGKIKAFWGFKNEARTGAPQP